MSKEELITFLKRQLVQVNRFKAKIEELTRENEKLAASKTAECDTQVNIISITGIVLYRVIDLH